MFNQFFVDFQNNVEKVRSLLELGAEPNTQDFSRWTPLHEAAQVPIFLFFAEFANFISLT
jgi:hypothetical protein